MPQSPLCLRRMLWSLLIGAVRSYPAGGTQGQERAKMPALVVSCRSSNCLTLAISGTRTYLLLGWCSMSQHCWPILNTSSWAGLQWALRSWRRRWFGARHQEWGTSGMKVKQHVIVNWNFQPFFFLHSPASQRPTRAQTSYACLKLYIPSLPILRENSWTSLGLKKIVFCKENHLRDTYTVRFMGCHLLNPVKEPVPSF